MRLAILHVALVLLCPRVVAAAWLDGGDAVIPAGREELLAEMLGRGQTLAGECRFAAAIG